MHCPTLAQLAALLDEIGSPEVVAIEEHVEHCAACQQALARLVEPENARMIPPDNPEASVGDSSTFLDFLKEHPPELASPRPASNGLGLRFPGEPTARGPLGTLEQFHIQSLLGSGAFGFVYKAWDETLRQTVALKILKPEFASNPTERARFEREARKAAAVRHANVIAIHRFASCSGFAVPFLVMEFVDGETLQARLDREGALPPGEAARIAREVALGLSAAHAQGVVHRDIKPSNIMLEKETGRVKISDFGLARAVEGGTQITRSGGIAGTPAYMSPEQIRSPQHIDARSDLFSLGSVLYVMLTGTQPFRGTLHMVLQQVVQEDPTTLTRLNNRVPLDLETITMKCLFKEPARRYASATEVAEELRRWSVGEPIVARPVSTLERSWRWARRNPALAIASGLAALSLLLVFVGTIIFVRELIHARDATEKALILSQDQLRLAARLSLAQGCTLCEQGDIPRGLLWFARGLELAPDDTDNLRTLLRRQIAGWRPHLGRLRAVERFPASIKSAQFSPDGKTLILAGADRSIYQWEFGSGVPSKRLVSSETVQRITFDPSGKTFVTWSADEAVQVWDTHPLTLRPRSDRARGNLAIGFRPGGEVLLAEFNESELDVRILGQSSVFRHPSPGERIEEAVFSADGSRLLIRLNHRVECWAWLTKTLEFTLTHPQSVRAAVLAIPGSTIATACDDGKVRLWDGASGKLQREIAPDTLVSALAFSPDGTHLLTAGVRDSAILWNAKTGNQLFWLTHPSNIIHVGFSPDGQTLHTRGDKDACQYRVVSGQLVDRIEQPLLLAGRAFERPALTLDPVNSLIVTANIQGDVKVWQPPAFLASAEAWLELNEQPQSVEFAGKGNSIQIRSAVGDAWTWTGERDSKPRRLSYPLPKSLKDSITRSIASPDGSLILYVVRDEKKGKDQNGFLVKIVDIERAPEPKTLSLPPTEKERIRYPQWLRASFDRKRHIVGCRGGVFVFDAVSGTCLLTWKSPIKSPVSALAVSPTASSMLVGCDDGLAHLLEMTDAKALCDPLKHDRDVVSVAFTDSGRKLRTISGDGRALAWDIHGRPDGEPVLVGDGITGGAFDPTGRWIACRTLGESLRLWDSSTQLPLGGPLRHPTYISSVGFHPATDQFLTTCIDGTVRRWRIPEPIGGTPEQVRLRVEAATGMKMTDRGVVQALSRQDWQQRQEAVAEHGAPPR